MTSVAVVGQAEAYLASYWRWEEDNLLVVSQGGSEMDVVAVLGGADAACPVQYDLEGVLVDLAACWLVDWQRPLRDVELDAVVVKAARLVDLAFDRVQNLLQQRAWALAPPADREYPLREVLEDLDWDDFEVLHAPLHSASPFRLLDPCACIHSLRAETRACDRVVEAVY